MDLTFELISCDDVMWNWFAQLLHNCPKLQSLTIQMVCLLLVILF